MADFPSTLVNILEKSNFPFKNTPETFQWMSSIDGAEQFFNWFTNLITEDNIVTNDEMICYNHIVESGKVLNDNELDTRINSYISNEPNLHLEDISIAGLEEAIESKKKMVNDLCLLKNRLSMEVSNQELKTIDSSVDNLLKEQVDEVEYANVEYMKQFTILEKKFEKLCDNIASLDEVDQKPVYFCQQNLKKIDNITSNLNLKIKIIKNEICEENSTDSDLNIENIVPDDLMNLIFNWMVQEEYSIADYKAKHFAASKVSEYLEELENNIENMNSLFLNQSSPVLKPSKDQLIQSCEIYMKDTIRGIQLNICQERLKKRKSKLALLETFENIVKTRKLCNESLCLLLMNEWKTLRASVSLLKDIHSCWELDLSEFKKRMSWMSHLICEQQLPICNISLKDTKQYSGQLSVSFNSSVQSVNNPYNSVICEILTTPKMSISVDFENFCSTVREIIYKIKRIDHFLFTKKPTTCNQNIMDYLKNIAALSKTVSIKDVTEEYENYKSKVENEKDLLHMMWYEWNKNPFDVIQTILKMEEAARIKKKRLSMVRQKELSTAEFKEYSKF